MCGAGPVDLRGSRGPRGRPDHENDQFLASAKTHPLATTERSGDQCIPSCPPYSTRCFVAGAGASEQPQKHPLQDLLQNPLRGPPQTGRVKIKIFGPVLRRVSPETDPKTLEIGISSKNGAERTQNQPRRPIPRPFRGDFRCGLGGGMFTDAAIWARPKKGGKRGVKIKIFGPVLRGFNPEIDPGTPLDRPGPPRTSIRTEKSAPGDQF